MGRASGWSNTVMVKRYANLSVEHLAEYAQRPRLEQAATAPYLGRAIQATRWVSRIPRSSVMISSVVRTRQ